MCIGDTNSVLTYTRRSVGLQGVPEVTPAYRPIVRVLAGVLAASVAMVTSHCDYKTINW